MEDILTSFIKSQSGLVLFFLLLFSIFILTKGADLTIDGVISLASFTKIPKIVISATIVSLGTTMPEAFVSVMAAWKGNPDLSLGNGVGSIIADTGLILGLICILAKVPVNRFILNVTGWIQVGVSTLLVLLSFSFLIFFQRPMIFRWVGFSFLFLLFLYMWFSYKWSKKLSMYFSNEEEKKGFWFGILWVLVGLLGVILGAKILIPTAIEIALRMHIPNDVVAATMVALGTSLPELSTGIAAVKKGYPEIMVGNVVGADILNCLFVIGASAAATPLFISKNFYILHFPFLLFILYSFRFFIFINKDGYFKRWQGLWLLGSYVIYLSFQYIK